MRGTCSHRQGVRSLLRGYSVTQQCGRVEGASALFGAQQRWQGPRAVPLEGRYSNQTVVEAKLEQGAHWLVSLLMGRGGMMGNSALQCHLAEAERHSNGVSANKVPSSSSPLQPNGCLVFGISPLKQACDSEKITRWFA